MCNLINIKATICGPIKRAMKKDDSFAKIVRNIRSQARLRKDEGFVVPNIRYKAGSAGLYGFAR